MIDFFGGFMRKRVDLYMMPDNSDCTDAKEFLEQQDLYLNVRDISSKPLNEAELSKLIRYFNMKHFLDTSSKAYTANKLDKFMPSRGEVIALMADDNDLLRKPIIVAGRLMVVGANRRKLMEMLQIKSNGDNPAGSGNADRNSQKN